MSGRDSKMLSETPYRVLSIDGGGFLGLATATFIQHIERHFSVRFADTFDLFCGTSTGAIIVAALAIGKSGDEIAALYKDLGPKVFGAKKAIGWIRAKYSIEKLEECLRPQLSDIRLGDIRESGKSILITAFNRTTGKPRIFKTDHSQQLSTDSELSLLDVVLASTSAPTYFRSITIQNPTTELSEVFCDGGVACNHPALLGFGEAAYELGNSPSRIRLLSLSTPREDLGKSYESLGDADHGIIQWRNSISSILIDSNSALVHETLRRLVEVFGDRRPRYVRIELENRNRLQFDDVSPIATRSLVEVGSRAATIQKTRADVKTILHE